MNNCAFTKFIITFLLSVILPPPFSLSPNLNLNARFSSSSLRTPGHLRTCPRNASKAARTASRFHHLIPVNSGLAEDGAAGFSSIGSVSSSAKASATFTDEDDVSPGKWTTDGKFVRELCDLPLAEGVPIAFNSVRKGVMSINWKAEVFREQIQDVGDAKVEVSPCDKIYTLPAKPQEGEQPEILHELD